MSRGNQGGARAQPFAPIQAPRICSISRKDVQVFLSERAAYEDAVSGQAGLKPVPYRTCFEAVCLESLVDAQVFGSEVATVS
eukprot:IDg21097t1